MKDTFILAGNGPYDNRGCEAILRGTVSILNRHFPSSEFLAVSNFQTDGQFSSQKNAEFDRSVRHAKTFRAWHEWNPLRLPQLALRLAASSILGKIIYKDILSTLPSARAVLSVGGDNYSLDYGNPYLYILLDNLVLSYRKPLIIWGASVGPFDRDPVFEKKMIEHLKKVTAIFVRESLSYQYLTSKGLTKNVHLVADPAFLLEPRKPDDAPYIEPGAVGVNLSPLMAQYLTDGDQRRWVMLAVDFIRTLQQKSGRKVYLIPHVTSPHTNDHTFLKDVFSELNDDGVTLVSDKYNAAELKWIISQMAVFIGARTHATIAAFSSCVPTLSLAYSVKAVGLNKDIFGHDDFCILGNSFDPSLIADKVCDVLRQENVCRKLLRERIPHFQELALSSGALLKKLL